MGDGLRVAEVAGTGMDSIPSWLDWTPARDETNALTKALLPTPTSPSRRKRSEAAEDEVSSMPKSNLDGYK